VESGKFPGGVSLSGGVTFGRVAVFSVVADCAALCGAWCEVHSAGGCVWRLVLVSLAAKLL
jgi:hypothetical protein